MSNSVRTPKFRVLQVTVLLAEGLCLKAVALRLKISVKTAEYHWDMAKRLYGFRSYVDACRWAIRRGFIKP